MPMRYTIDADARRVLIVGSGAVTDEDLTGCVRALRADPGLEPGMNTLSDMRGIEMRFTSEGVGAMLDVMERTEDRRGPARAAIVTSTTVAFGMGRMLELRARDRVSPDFEIFSDMDEALAWLDGDGAPGQS